MLNELAPRVSGRYEIVDILGGGGMGIVYRVHDLLTGSTVALKSVEFILDLPDYVSSSTVLDLRSALTREFQVLASLYHPNIIKVLDYGFDQKQRPYFTMEFVEEMQRITEYAAGISPEARIDLIIQMMEALIYLHRHGVLHCDLKPDNVVMMKNGTVRLLDFGLATARQYMHEDPEYPHGTITHVAPELIDNRINSEASDLYAAGLVVYQMMTGHYPFKLSGSVDDLIDSIRLDTPDFDRIPVPAVRPFVARLMERVPGDRYPSAEAALADLARLTGQPIVETPTLRESYLQSARLVGRERELNVLSAALDAALSGAGSTWLLAGESGIGKSRVMEELRIRALIRGALTLRGQAASEGGSLYSLWHDVLRLLVLNTTVSDFEAVVLKMVIPDIGVLLNRDVGDAAEIEPQAAKERFFKVVEALFQRQAQPIVLLIEDLQWASESLVLLDRLSRLVSALPLLIIGTYRNDERPDLPAVLPLAQVIELHRFGTAEISALSVAILGEEAGTRADLLRLLDRETEGNAFFVVEVLRALAEEAGQLTALRRAQFSETVAARGIITVIERRLRQINPEDRVLLELAAVAGRQLDLPVLQAMSPGLALDRWLLRCSSVLEINQNQWRFAHDKLREGTLAVIAEDQRPHLHRQVAQALEQVYGDDPDVALMQSYHWAQAAEDEKETYYSALAGMRLLQQGLYEESNKRLSRAHALAANLNFPPLWRARLARTLADSCLGMGMVMRPINYLHEALEHLGIDASTDAASIAQRLGRDELRLVTEVELELGYGYIEYTIEPMQSIDHLLRAASIQEILGQRAEQADAYAMLATGLMTAGDPVRAADYAQRASALLDTVSEADAPLSVLARTRSNLAYYWTFAAKWEASIRDGELSAELYERIGDLLRWRGTLMNLATSYEWRGDFRRGMAMRSQEYEIAQRGNNITGQIRALAGVGQLQAYLGQIEASRDSLEHRGDLIAQTDNKSSTRWTYLGMVYYRLGQLDKAREALPRAVEEVARIMVPTAHDMFSIPNTAELLLGLWEHDPEAAAALHEPAQMVMERVIEYGRRYPAGEPLMLVIEGRYEWLRGNEDRAWALWERALALAVERETPYAHGLAHYEIGRHLPPNAPARAEQLDSAHTLFKRMGMRYNQQLTEQAMRG